MTSITGSHDGLHGGDAQWWLGSGYLLRDRLGAGTSGEVWRVSARDSDLPLAAKLLRPELVSDPEAQRRFLQEGYALRDLVHPHLVRVHDVVCGAGKLAIVMDYVAGPSLRELLALRRTLAPGLLAEFGADVASALAAAHTAGVVHRDVKPENILVVEDSERLVPYLADLGTARLHDGPGLTARGSVPGTPAYFAPELRAGGVATAASDVYALGLLLCEALVGRRLTDEELREADRGRTRPDVVAGVPDALWEVLRGCLAARPRRRPPADDLAQLLHHAGLAVAQLPALPAAPALEAVRALGTGATTGPARSSPARRRPRQTAGVGGTPARRRALLATLSLAVGGTLVAATLHEPSREAADVDTSSTATRSAPPGDFEAPSSAARRPFAGAPAADGPPGGETDAPPTVPEAAPQDGSVTAAGTDSGEPSLAEPARDVPPPAAEQAPQSAAASVGRTPALADVSTAAPPRTAPSDPPATRAPVPTLNPPVGPKQPPGDCYGDLLETYQHISPDGVLQAETTVWYDPATGRTCADLIKVALYDTRSYTSLVICNTAGACTTDRDYYKREAGPVSVDSNGTCVSVAAYGLDPSRTTVLYDHTLPSAGCG